MITMIIMIKNKQKDRQMDIIIVQSPFAAGT